MPTGVRTADIIAGVYGARHRGKMQEAEARQYMTQQEERRAQAKAEGEERLFSRKARIFSLTGDPAAAEQVATTGDFSGMKLKPTAQDLKNNQEDEQAQRGIKFMQRPDVQEKIANRDDVGLITLAAQDGIINVEKIPDVIHRSSMRDLESRTVRVAEKGITSLEEYQEAQEIIGVGRQERSEFDLRKSRLEGWKKFKSDLTKWAHDNFIPPEEVESFLASNPKARSTAPSPGTYGLPEDYDSEFEQEDLSYTTDKSRRERIDRLSDYEGAVKKKAASVDVLMRYGQTLMPQSGQAGTEWDILEGLNQK
jgi:hypothetical protein